MKRVNLLAAGVLAFAQTLAGAAVAAPVTLTGSTVDFAFDDALLGLFGPASVAGDTLFFTPTAFEAQSLNGAGFSLTRATLNIRLTAHAGHGFESVGVAERGDYLLLGAGGMADVGGQVRVFNVASPLADLTAAIASPVPMTATGLPTHDWSAGAFVDVSGLGARALNVTLENLLVAATFDPAALAFVEKKFAALTVDTVAVTPVPEADRYAMMLAGLGLVGWAALRRRTAAT